MKSFYIAGICFLVYSHVQSQTTTYSETFTNGNPPTTTQCTNWNNWRTTLDTCYTQVTISSSLGCNETCTDVTIVRQIISALITGGNGSWVYGSKEWYVSNALGVFIGVFSTIGSSPTQCDSSIVVMRPCINTSNWGGCNHNDCGAPTQTLSITFSGGLVTPMSKTDLLCYGDNSGTATVSPSGGNSPYTFQWDANTGNQTTATATGLSAGTFAVTVTDNTGCQSEDSVTINQPSQISLSVLGTEETCFEDSTGTASANASGGTSPYAYAWDSGTGNQTASVATGLTAGTYYVTISDDNGCTEMDSVTLLSPSEILTSFNSTDLMCYGDSNGTAAVIVSGGISPFSYVWDAGAGNQTDSLATGLGAGTYSVTVTDSNGCTKADAVTINQPLQIAISISTTDDNGGCTGSATATASGGTSPYTYQWNDTNNQTAQTATGLCTGYYCVTVTDSNACSVISCDSVQLTIGSIELSPSDNMFIIYPNPGSEWLTIENRGKVLHYSLEICNILGQVLLRTELSHKTEQLDLTSFRNGTYIIRMLTGNSIYKTLRFIKQ